ncbi:hypothetical protein EON67_04845, partial [archaeon]
MRRCCPCWMRRTRSCTCTCAWCATSSCTWYACALPAHTRAPRSCVCARTHSVALHHVALQDRTYVAQQSKLPVYALARLCFQEGVVWNAKLRDRISCQLLEGVEALRHDAIGDAATLRSVIAALLQISATAPPNSINVYANVFELPMLEHTSKVRFHVHSAFQRATRPPLPACVY